MRTHRLLAGTIIALMSVGVFAVAHAAPGDDVITACVNDNSGALRVVNDGECRENEEPLSWDAAGATSVPTVLDLNGGITPEPGREPDGQSAFSEAGRMTLPPGQWRVDANFALNSLDAMTDARVFGDCQLFAAESGRWSGRSNTISGEWRTKHLTQTLLVDLPSGGDVVAGCGVHEGDIFVGYHLTATTVTIGDLPSP